MGSISSATSYASSVALGASGIHSTKIGLKMEEDVLSGESPEEKAKDIDQFAEIDEASN